MDAVRQYIIQVTAAALICGIVIAVTDKRSGTGSVTRLMTVLFMTLTILSPLVKIRLSEISGIFNYISNDAADAVEYGEEQSQNAIAAIIKQETEAYILEKAESLGAVISVRIQVSDEQIPVPVGVRISGAVSPYGKQRLRQLISDELGIPLEEQEWVE